MNIISDYKSAMKKILEQEFTSSSDALHKNTTETGYTFMGIYEVAHPKWAGWKFIKDSIKKFKTLQEASKECYNNEELKQQVYLFYKNEFWDKAKLDFINQHIAEEIFMFGVNAGMPEAVSHAQRLAGIPEKEIDGKVGPQSIKALNNINIELFDKYYDMIEIAYYSGLIRGNPKHKIYFNGWKNRAYNI